jgi:Tfp pilus assembly pilus retraction ATPase PilT
METGGKSGMILMDAYIAELAKKGLIDPKHAFESVIDQEGFKEVIRPKKKAPADA